MTVQPPANYDLYQLREWLRAQLEAGVTCPCCDQHAQQYRRSITRSMVSSMAKLLAAQESKGEETDVWSFVHLPDVPQRSRDTTMLRYWSLIEEESTRRPDGGRTGYWRVSMIGKRWLNGHWSVRRYAHVYNNEVRAFSGPETFVGDVVGGFDLREAMNA